MANTKIQLKRSSVAGKIPTTSDISIGELGLNLTDRILYSSDGTNIFAVGANLVNQRITNAITIDNDKNLYWRTVNTSATVGMRQQSDDNFVFYSTNTTYGARPVFSIFANSDTSAFSFSTPVTFNANVTKLAANGTTGTASQVLTADGSGGIYWSSPGAASVNVQAQYTWTNTQTFQANISFTGNNISFVTNTGSVLFNGSADANWRIGRNTGGTTKFFYTGNTVDIIAANSALEGIAFGFTGNSYLETGYAGTFTRLPVYVGNTVENVSTTNTTIKIQTNTTVNSTMTASLVQVSNSTATSNLTATSVNIYANSTVNASMSATTISVANSTGNVTAIPTSVTVQNSTVNSVMGLQSLIIQANTTVNGSITQALMQVANSTGNVQHTATSILAQTNTTVNSTMTSSLLQVSNSTSTANLTALDLKIGATTVVNSTQVTATLVVANVSGSYANITGQVNTATLYATTSANIASVVQANSTGIWTTATANALNFTAGAGFGGATAGATVNSGTIGISSNTTVNSSATGTLVQVANSTGNVQHSATSLTVQNSTVNAVMGLQSLIIQANTTVNGSITNALVQVANSTGNVQHSATSILSQTNTTVNSTVSATTISIANATGNIAIVPTSVTVQNSTVNSVLGLNTLLIQSNTTVNSSISNTLIQVANSTGNAQHSATSILVQTNTTVNSTHTASLLQVSNSTSTANLTALDLKIGATTVVNSTQVTATLHVGNVSGSYANITGQVNTATLYAATSANIASAVQANSTGVWTTGTVNAASHTVGTAFTANSTVVNAVSYYSGTLLVANSTVVNATHLGGTAAASYVNTTGNYTVAGNINFTAANNFFNFVTISGGSKISVMENQDGGSSRGIFLWNDNDTNWGIYMSQAGALKSLGNGTAAAGLNGSSTYAVRFRAANATPTDQAGFIWENQTEVALMQLEPTNGDLFVKRNINAAAHSVGSSFIANTTQVTITLPISANGSTGTAGQVLTTGGAGVNAYWADASGGGGVYLKGGTTTIGTLASEGQNIFRVNADTLNNDTTIVTGENAQATGPLTVASGKTLTVQTGARVSIV